ncbi:MAG: hypothetical protein JXB30_02625 [Anaerolineae bacterium]|nr:hypothetical protein [Anaerolineae bacterium]
MLRLIGYSLGAGDTEIEPDVSKRLKIMGSGHDALVQATGRDFGYNLQKWRRFLCRNGEKFGYTHPYAYEAVDQVVQWAIDDPEFQRLAKLLGDSSARP